MGHVAEAFSSLGLLWLRVLMGVGIAYHGFGKIFGGGMERFTLGVADLGFPAPAVFAWAAAFSEFLGGLMVALGIGTRIGAFFVFATMSVAAFVHHAADSFSVKELALAYWAMAGALVMTGPGEFSLDAKLWKK